MATTADTTAFVAASVHNPDPDAQNMAQGAYGAGHQAMQGIKRKFNMEEEPPYDNDFEQPVLDEPKPMELQGPIWSIDVPSWDACARIMKGEMEVELSVHKNDNSNLPDNYDDLGQDGFFVRPGFGTNLVDTVDVLVNGQSIHREENHGPLSYLNDLLTTTKEEEDYKYQHYFYGRLQEHTITVANRGQALTAEAAYLGPDTLPGVAQNDNAGGQIKLSEQKAYADKWTKPFLGSKKIIMRFCLRHPLFQTTKVYPPNFSCQIQIKLAAAATLFTCRPTNIPTVKFHRVHYVDRLMRLNTEAAEKWVSDILRNKGRIVMPVQRNIVFQHSLPMGTTQHVLRALTGRIPDRMSVFFVPNDAWRSANCQKNPCNWQYMGQTEMVCQYGERYWPHRNARWRDVPVAITPGTRLTTAQKEETVRRNWPHIKDHMGVFFPHNQLYKLAMTYEDFVGVCNVWSYDFTSLGLKAITGEMKYKNYQGHIDLFMRWVGATPRDRTRLCIIVAEYENTVEYSVPDFTAKTDF